MGAVADAAATAAAVATMCADNSDASMDGTLPPTSPSPPIAVLPITVAPVVLPSRMEVEAEDPTACELGW